MVKRTLVATFVVLFLLIFFTKNASAQTFSVGPTKLVYKFKPGDSITTRIRIANQLGKPTSFKIWVEDFEPNNNPDNYTKFLGNEFSQHYSSRNWISPSDSAIHLEDNQQNDINININVPRDAEPGEHYSVVFVQPDNSSSGGIELSSRIGTLLLINIEGAINPKGQLKSFEINNKIVVDGNITFNIDYSNIGNVHLSPFGKIYIYNIFGNVIHASDVQPWTVLRDSTRTKEVKVDFTNKYLNFYKAKIEIGHEYTDQKETMELNLVIFNYKKVALPALTILLLFTIFFVFINNYEIKHKK